MAQRGGRVYTEEELKKLGAKPGPAQATTTPVAPTPPPASSKSYTVEELQKLGAKPGPTSTGSTILMPPVMPPNSSTVNNAPVDNPLMSGAGHALSGIANFVSPWTPSRGAAMPGFLEPFIPFNPSDEKNKGEILRSIRVPPVVPGVINALGAVGGGPPTSRPGQPPTVPEPPAERAGREALEPFSTTIEGAGQLLNSPSSGPPITDQQWAETQEGAGAFLAGTLLPGAAEGIARRIPNPADVLFGEHGIGGIRGGPPGGNGGGPTTGTSGIQRPATNAPLSPPPTSSNVPPAPGTFRQTPYHQVFEALNPTDAELYTRLPHAMDELAAARESGLPVRTGLDQEAALAARAMHRNQQIRTLIEPLGDPPIPGSRAADIHSQIRGLEEIRLTDPRKYTRMVKDVMKEATKPDFTLTELDDMRANTGNALSPYYGKDLSGQLMMEAGVRARDIARAQNAHSMFYDALKDQGVERGSLGVQTADAVRYLNQQIGATIHMEDALRLRRNESIIAGGKTTAGKWASGLRHPIKAVGGELSAPDVRISNAISRWSDRPWELIAPSALPPSLMDTQMRSMADRAGMTGVKFPMPERPAPFSTATNPAPPSSTIPGIPSDVRPHAFAQPTAAPPGGFLGQLSQPRPTSPGIELHSTVGGYKPAPTGQLADLGRAGVLEPPAPAAVPPSITPPGGFLADLGASRPRQPGFLEQLGQSTAAQPATSQHIPVPDVNMMWNTPEPANQLPPGRPVGEGFVFSEAPTYGPNRYDVAHSTTPLLDQLQATVTPTGTNPAFYNALHSPELRGLFAKQQQAMTPVAFKLWEQQALEILKRHYGIVSPEEANYGTIPEGPRIIPADR